MPLPPGRGKRGRAKKCSLNVVKDEKRTNGLITGDAEDHAKWRTSQKADHGLLRTRLELQLGRRQDDDDDYMSYQHVPLYNSKVGAELCRHLWLHFPVLMVLQLKVNKSKSKKRKIIRLMKRGPHSLLSRLAPLPKAVSHNPGTYGAAGH